MAIAKVGSHHRWLGLTAVPESDRDDLLEAPVSMQSLFLLLCIEMRKREHSKDPQRHDESQDRKGQVAQAGATAYMHSPCITIQYEQQKCCKETAADLQRYGHMICSQLLSQILCFFRWCLSFSVQEGARSNHGLTMTSENLERLLGNKEKLTTFQLSISY